MIKIGVKCVTCGEGYSKEVQGDFWESSIMTTYACPKCNKNWLKTNTSKVDWKYFPIQKSILKDEMEKV